MSDGEGPGSGTGNSGWLIGCAIAGGIVAVLLLVVVGLGVVGVFFSVKNMNQQMNQMVVAYPPVPSTGGSVSPTGGEAGEAAAEPVHYPVVVKLSGVTPKGVKYALVGEGEDDEGDAEDLVCEGDAALIAVLREIAAGEADDPDDDRMLVVDLDVATAVPVKQEHVDAAVKACWSAGAAVLPPPDLSREKPAAPAAEPAAEKKEAVL